MSLSQTEARSVTRRYIEALFSLASEKKQVDEVRAALEHFQSALQESEALERLLGNRAAGRQAQGSAVAAVLKALGISGLVADFFRVLAENGRLEVAPYLAEAFAARVRESRDETVAEVTSAHSLTPEQVKELQAVITKVTGRSAVEVRVQEDKRLLGGVIVRVDGKMLDHSVAGKIDKLAARMWAQA